MTKKEIHKPEELKASGLDQKTGPGRFSDKQYEFLHKWLRAMGFVEQPTVSPLKGMVSGVTATKTSPSSVATKQKIGTPTASPLEGRGFQTIRSTKLWDSSDHASKEKTVFTSPQPEETTYQLHAKTGSHVVVYGLVKINEYDTEEPEYILRKAKRGIEREESSDDANESKVDDDEASKRRKRMQKEVRRVDGWFRVTLPVVL